MKRELTSGRLGVNISRLQELERSSGPLVLTVHGTGDAEPGEVQPKWWQPGSSFESNLRSNRPNANVLPFHWSGANSDTERDKAARALAYVLRRLGKKKQPVTIVAHSHGANVLMSAFRFHGAAKNIHRDTHAVSLGTPFFKSDYRRTVSLLQWICVGLLMSWGFALLGSWATFGGYLDDIASMDGQNPNPDWRGGLKWVFLYYFRISEVFPSDKMRTVVAAQLWNFIIIYLPLNTVLAVTAWWLGGQRVFRRVAYSLRDKSKLNDRWTTILHPQDEVVAALQSVHKTRLRLLSAPGMTRSIMRGAVILAILAGLSGGFLSAASQLFSEQELQINCQVDYNLVILELRGTVLTDDQIHERADVAKEACEERKIEDYDRSVKLGLPMLADIILLKPAFMLSSPAADQPSGVAVDSRVWGANVIHLLFSTTLYYNLLMIGFVFALFHFALSGPLTFLANRSITGAARSAALGQDGDFRTTAVSNDVPYFRTAHIKLRDDQVESVDDKARAHLIAEAYTRLLPIDGGEPSSKTTSEIWQLFNHSIFHNCYGRERAVAELVASAIPPERTG